MRSLSSPTLHKHSRIILYPSKVLFSTLLNLRLSQEIAAAVSRGQTSFMVSWCDERDRAAQSFLTVVLAVAEVT